MKRLNKEELTYLKSQINRGLRRNKYLESYPIRHPGGRGPSSRLSIYSLSSKLQIVAHSAGGGCLSAI